MSLEGKVLGWLPPLTWVIENRLGERVEVDVEPATDGLYAVGDELEIEGERYRLVGRRGRMVGGRRDALDSAWTVVVGS